MTGKKRDHTPWQKKSRRSRASASTCSASSAVGAIDFSQSTARPARRQAIESSTCLSEGVATYTMSRLSSAIRACRRRAGRCQAVRRKHGAVGLVGSTSYDWCRVVVVLSRSCAFANSVARSTVREPTAATSTSSSCFSTLVKSDAIEPVPMMPQRTLDLVNLLCGGAASLDVPSMETRNTLASNAAEAVRMRRTRCTSAAGDAVGDLSQRVIRSGRRCNTLLVVRTR